MEPPAPSPSFWESLSPERRLDVIGIVLAILGILILLTLLASSRSEFSNWFVNHLTQIIGWGVYVLPLALITFGLWLILRKIERIPPLSLERTVGSVLLFLWLLTTLDAFRAPADSVSVAVTLVISLVASYGSALANWVS